MGTGLAVNLANTRLCNTVTQRPVCGHLWEVGGWAARMRSLVIDDIRGDSRPRVTLPVSVLPAASL